MNFLFFWYRWRARPVPPAPDAPVLCRDAHLTTTFVLDLESDQTIDLTTSFDAEFCPCS